jgi:phosphoglycerate dehydrogenase-like enzyme
VLGCDPYIDAAAAAIPLVAFDALLRASHLISLHVPLTGETRGMIGEAALSEMPEGAVLVNMCRGEVVDEAAILAALNTGRLAGYAADVLRGEVPGREMPSPLVSHPNVLLTTHTGAWTVETDARVCRAAVAGIRTWLDAGAG